MSTIESPLSVCVREMSDRPALITGDGRITYDEFDERAGKIARVLKNNGVGRGDRVGTLMGNTSAHVLTLHALWRLGAVAAPVSTRSPIRQIPSLIRRIDAQLLVTDDIGLPDDLDDVQILKTRDLEHAGDPVQAPAAIDPELPTTIVFTSGSSGRPKPVLHSYANHYYSAAGSNENISLGPDDRWLLSLPLYHVGGLAVLFRCMLAGAAVVAPKAEESIARTIDRYQVTHVSLVATQLRRLLTAHASAPGHLKAVLLGGGSIPQALVTEAVECEFPIHVSYGLTEMSSQVTTTPPDATRQQLRSSGQLLRYRELTIGEDNEILVRGPTLFLGYVSGGRRNPARDSNGWYHTGDIGHLDSDGYLHVVGRKDNMFISGGENIHPETIESTLEELPHIEAATVVPVRDAEFGFRPVAFVRWRQAPRPAAEVRAELSSSLPRYKLPIAILPWPERQETGEMKIDRDRLRTLAHEHLDR